MTSTADVRQALADAGSVCGRTVEPYFKGTVVAGCGYVLRREFDPRMVFGQTKVVYPYLVRFFFNGSAEASAQQEIDTLCDIAGYGSFLAAVQDEANWPDDLVDYAQVTLVGDIGETSIGGADYLTVDFDIEVVW